MSLPITFGVELEFNTAFLFDVEEDVLPTENKIVRFAPLPLEFGTGILVMERRIRASIGKTILAAGKYRIDMDNLAKENPQNWEVTGDSSIPDFQDQLGYHYRGIEVRSPALVFNEDSLHEIRAICELLTSTYRILNTTDTGLHIHLGHHDTSFELDDVKRLMIFLYTFEPQLSSLHPIHRRVQNFGRPVRDQSRFVANFQGKYGRTPRASDFAAEVLKCSNMFDLCLSIFSDQEGPKSGNYNFGNIGSASHPSSIFQCRKTIEFRQHEGTLDGGKITHWINVLVAVVEFVESSHPLAFTDLMKAVWRAEKWEKMGDGEDDARARELGTALEDHGFTIIDLLEYLGKNTQADYYRDKWHKHRIWPRQVDLRSDTAWSFVQERTMDKNSDQYQRNEEMVELFTSLRLSNRAERKAGRQQTPINSSLFPTHETDVNFMSDDEM